MPIPFCRHSPPPSAWRPRQSRRAYGGTGYPVGGCHPGQQVGNARVIMPVITTRTEHSSQEYSMAPWTGTSSVRTDGQSRMPGSRSSGRGKGPAGRNARPGAGLPLLPLPSLHQGDHPDHEQGDGGPGQQGSSDPNRKPMMAREQFQFGSRMAGLRLRHPVIRCAPFDVNLDHRHRPAPEARRSVCRNASRTTLADRLSLTFRSRTTGEDAGNQTSPRCCA